jgi:hypothetical protein
MLCVLTISATAITTSMTAMSSVAMASHNAISTLSITAATANASPDQRAGVFQHHHR